MVLEVEEGTLAELDLAVEEVEPCAVADPAGGSWRGDHLLSRDPLGEFANGSGSAGDMNLYAYVGNNPLNFVDVYGLAPKDKGFGLAKAFWRWYHRVIKEAGDPDLIKEEAEELFKKWDRLGRPGPDSKRIRGPKGPRGFGGGCEVIVFNPCLLAPWLFPELCGAEPPLG